MTPDDRKALRKAAERQRHWSAERDRLVCEAVADGASLRAVAAVVGLSHSAVAKIVKKANQ